VTIPHSAVTGVIAQQWLSALLGLEVEFDPDRSLKQVAKPEKLTQFIALLGLTGRKGRKTLQNALHGQLSKHCMNTLRLLSLVWFCDDMLKDPEVRSAAFTRLGLSEILTKLDAIYSFGEPEPVGIGALLLEVLLATQLAYRSVNRLSIESPLPVDAPLLLPEDIQEMVVNAIDHLDAVFTLHVRQMKFHMDSSPTITVSLAGTRVTLSYSCPTPVPVS
jgi:hypothetical protein